MMVTISEAQHSEINGFVQYILYYLFSRLIYGNLISKAFLRLIYGHSAPVFHRKLREIRNRSKPKESQLLARLLDMQPTKVFGKIMT
jgi:hypothetical protein